MLRKNNFVEQIQMYFTVIEAHLNGVQQLDVHKLKSIHHCLDLGTNYFSEHTNEHKKIKKYKITIKDKLQEIYSQNPILALDQRIQNVDIEVLYFSLPGKEKDTGEEGDELDLASA